MATAKAPKKADVKEEKDAKKEAKSPKEDKKVIIMGCIKKYVISCGR